MKSSHGLQPGAKEGKKQSEARGTFVAKILLVEDDKDLNNLVRTFLLCEHHTVETTFNGADADGLIQCGNYELIVLDWDLPGKTGIELLRDLRATGSTTPVLMLTGKGGIDEKMSGLDSGADDYLTKPFNMRELGARVRALLRRPAAISSNNVLTGAGIQLDVSKYRVVKDGQPISLLPKEFQLLEFMMRHPNQVFTADALLLRVWPSDSEATAEALRSTVKRIRKKVDPAGELLRTVHGVGYILEIS
jgi:two-component system response regulator TctD